MSQSNVEIGDKLPRIETQIPGPESTAAVDSLSQTECPAITARRARRASEVGADKDPIVWSEARGANVVDVDGNRFVDLTSAFAVCGLGHRHPVVVDYLKEQADELIHAMGDVYPSDVKISLNEKLAEITPGELQQSILGLSGSDAVQAALKTAVIHTGKSGVISFSGAYHGLEYGALSVTGYREAFREPFRDQMGIDVTHVPFPNRHRPPLGLAEEASLARIRDRVLEHIDTLLSGSANGVGDIGAMIVEPIQGRGGKVVPPKDFLAGLKRICNDHGIVLIFDEIFTGFGRTGQMFAAQADQVVPDLLCTGKAMGGGFPISAVIGRPDVMASWRLSEGEAIHTSTFLGNPMGCAMASAVLDELDDDWLQRVRDKGELIKNKFADLKNDFPLHLGPIRGRGLMLGVGIRDENKQPNSKLARTLMDRLRRHGYLVLLSGRLGDILSLTPPFIITRAQIDGFFDVLSNELEKTRGSGSVA